MKAAAVNFVPVSKALATPIFVNKFTAISASVTTRATPGTSLCYCFSGVKTTSSSVNLSIRQPGTVTRIPKNVSFLI